VVIGGGLTAIDAATEIAAYYPVQVERTLEHYRLLCADLGTDRVRRDCGPDELAILDVYLEHGRAVEAERARARDTGEEPDLARLVRPGWREPGTGNHRRKPRLPAEPRGSDQVARGGIRFAEGPRPPRRSRMRVGAGGDSL
jgi:hypothetical protein